jgi:hypothetical protein
MQTASERGLYKQEDQNQEAIELGVREFIFGLKPSLDM